MTLSQNLNISGVANVDKTSWNIHFTNVLTPKVEGQATGGKAVLNSESTVITISEGTLSAPGDKIIYTFDVINEGDLPAEVETTLTQMKSCTAENGSDVSIFCNKIGLDLVYAETNTKVQKSDRLLSKEKKTLNLIITYGNLGTTGVLTTGDAFDCDVNGDGVYDSTKERFYYVSDYYDTNTKTFDSNYATLIYYNNVSSGQPANTKYAYDSSNENWHGPRTAIAQLPTSSQWNNISLKNNTRAILNEGGGNTTTGETLPSNYSYTGYAARFLTFQEVKKGTGINIPTWKTGELDNFTYLLENTKFASDKNNALTWWLENARSDTSASAWDVNGDGRNVQTTTVFRMPATLEFVQQ